MTTRTPSSYADRAEAFQVAAAAARAANEPGRAADLEALATRCRSAHLTRPWRTADDLRYGVDDCCVECEQHVSDSHHPSCIYGEVAHAIA